MTSQVAPAVNNLLANAGDVRKAVFIPGSRRSPRVGNGNPLQFSCLENPMDRGAWWATVLGVAESDRTEPAHTHAHAHTRTYYNGCILVKLLGKKTAVLIWGSFGGEDEIAESSPCPLFPIPFGKGNYFLEQHANFLSTVYSGIGIITLLMDGILI